MAFGIAPAQSVEAELPVGKVDLLAHQSVAPVVANRERSAKQMNVPVIVSLLENKTSTSVTFLALEAYVSSGEALRTFFRPRICKTEP